MTSYFSAPASGLAAQNDLTEVKIMKVVIFNEDTDITLEWFTEGS